MALPRAAASIFATLLVTAAPGTRADGPTPAAPTLAELGELAYRDVVEDRALQLAGGVWRSEPAPGAPEAILRLLPAPFATGDLDGDGTPEAAALLAAHGSRTESYRLLAVVARRPAGLENIATFRLGDGVQVSALRFVDGALEVALGRPGAVAARGVVRHFVAAPGGVREAVGLAALGDVYWEVVVWDGRALTIPPRPSIAVAGSRLIGSGSCRRYRARFLVEDGWRLRIGEPQLMPRVCPKVMLARDDLFFAQLAAAERLERVGDRLELVSREGDREVRLRLAPADQR